MKSFFLIGSIYFASIFLIDAYAQTPGDECYNAIPYPGDVVNTICVSSYDFTPFTDTGNSPFPTCDFGSDASAWFTFTAPITTVAGEPLYLSFDDGDGMINDCSLGVQFYAVDCLTPVSNCMPNQNGNIAGLTQGTNYLMQIWDDQMGGFSCDFCLTLAPDPPPGNECDDAIAYTGDIINGTCVTGFDFTNYTGSATSPLLSCGPIGDFSVWFTVTTPIITASGDPIDLFFDNGDGQINQCDLSIEFFALDCNTPVSNCYIVNSGIITGLTQGTDYLMLIDNQFGDITCDFCLTLPPPPPVNNDCSGAIPYPGNIAGSGCVGNFDFDGYTDSGLSPSPSCDAGDPNAWYSFTVPITTSAGDPITLQWDIGYYCYVGIEIYEPGCMTSVSSCLNNFSGSLPGLIQGNDYLLVIWADGSNNSNCGFCLSVPTQPEPGGGCSNPIPYPGDITNGICVDNFNFSNNSAQSSSPNCGFIDQQTAWFTITTPVTTVVGDPIDLLFEAEYNDMGLQFYNLNCTSSVTGCMDSGGILTGLLQGTDYLIALGVESFPFGSGGGDFCIIIAPPPHPNDNCSGAIPYPGDVVNGVCVDDYNFLIANDSDPDIPSCWVSTQPDVWFSWTAPIISAPGDPIDLVFDSGQGQVDNCFLGIEFYALDCITPVSNCLNNVSNLITGLIQGQDYLMVVFADNPGESACDFCLTVAPPPAQGDECSDPLPYPGDVENGQCITGVDFNNYTYTNNSPQLYCTQTQQNIWYTITTPVTTTAGDPLELYFDAGNCDLSILFINANCINGLNNCMEGSGMISGLEQGRDYLFTINNIAWDGGNNICDFCLTLDGVVCPTANFTGLPSSSSSNTPIALTGTPAGGTFSGNGIFLNAFNPSVAGLGSHTVTYTYNDNNGCQGTATQNILVFMIAYNFVNYNLGTIDPKINGLGQETFSIQNVYPIPLNEVLNLELNSLVDDNATLILRSIDGKILQEVKTTLSKGLNKIQINVGQMANGYFILELKTNDNIVQFPVSK